MVPQTIGVYEIIEEIGSGPSAHVYQAVNKSTKKQVALKVLNPDVGQSASILTELQRAVVVASNLDDSHIAKVYDLGEDDGYHYIASEFIDGVPLQNLIQHYRKFEPEQACRIMEEVTKGLGAAHKQGIYHGNLLPSNVVIEKQTGRIVITDFGISRVLSLGSPAVASDPKRVGFVAPELSGGGEPDAHSDFFSVGAMFYYMLSGERPARGLVSTPGAALPQLPRLRSLLPSAPIWLETLIARMMTADPMERIISVDDIIEEIEVGLDESNGSAGNSASHQTREKRTAPPPSAPAAGATTNAENMRLLRSKTAGGTLGMLMRKQNVSSDVEESVQDAEKRLLNLEFNPGSGAVPPRPTAGPRRGARPATPSQEPAPVPPGALNAPKTEHLQIGAQPAAPPPAPEPLATTHSAGARQSRRSRSSVHEAVPPAAPPPAPEPDNSYLISYPGEEEEYPPEDYQSGDYSNQESYPQQAYPTQTDYPAQEGYPPQALTPEA